MISFHLVDQRENKWNEFNWYYNSKYIDAEETDVSRNQTSTWLIKAEVIPKEEIYRQFTFVLAAIQFQFVLVPFWREHQIDANQQSTETAATNTHVAG